MVNEEKSEGAISTIDPARMIRSGGDSRFTTDVLIIGQGICGTFLSWHLQKLGKRVLVIDEPQPFSATKVASGVINPVTGRQVVTTWMAETLMGYTWDAYKAIGDDIGAGVIRQANIIVFPPSQQMRDAYDKRIAEENGYIKTVAPTTADSLHNKFYQFFGTAEISPVWLADLFTLLNGWRKKLKGEGSLLEERFDEAHFSIQPNHVTYKNISAEKIIFCNGISAFSLPYFKNLPFVFNKGEALVAEIPSLVNNNIYKVGNSTLVPWSDGLWWVGSSYENNYADDLPTPLFKQKKMQELQMNLKVPFTIVDHLAALRPAVAVERRPFVGVHPFVNQIGILNGMGTKGCSLAPYFAEQLALNLTQQKPIDPLADVKRFKRIIGQ